MKGLTESDKKFSKDVMERHNKVMATKTEEQKKAIQEGLDSLIDMIATALEIPGMENEEGIILIRRMLVHPWMSEDKFDALICIGEAQGKYHRAYSDGGRPILVLGPLPEENGTKKGTKKTGEKGTKKTDEKGTVQ